MWVGTSHRVFDREREDEEEISGLERETLQEIFAVSERKKKEGLFL